MYLAEKDEKDYRGEDYRYGDRWKDATKRGSHKKGMNNLHGNDKDK